MENTWKEIGWSRGVSMPALSADVPSIGRRARSEHPFTARTRIGVQTKVTAFDLPGKIKQEPILEPAIKVQGTSPAPLDYGIPLQDTLQDVKYQSPHISPPPDKVASTDIKFSKLQDAIATIDYEVTDGYAQRITGTLDSLSSLLAGVVDNDSATRHLSSVEDLRIKSRTDARTLIAVVGNTGAGKSSIINALLGEQKVVPTNSMRACTASPIEISWNESTKTVDRYRAEIEFITQDEWEEELKHLFTDILDGTGEISNNIGNKETEAGIAYDKIRSVYPMMDGEALARLNARKLARNRSAHNVLGTTRKLNAGTAASLHSQIAQYVDSRDKNKAEIPDSSHSVLWPLIKVVKVYLQSDVLSTGAVLVDLPGFGDSNAARAAVASKYIERCQNIWVVAPIVRAVDDKTAQTLLGDSFKRQLQFDGGLENVSLICSQTDNICIDDTYKSVGLDREYEDACTLEEKYERELPVKKNEKKRLDQARNNAYSEVLSINTNIKTWQKLATKQAKGEKVYAPTQKRKPKTQKVPSTANNRRSRRSAPTSRTQDNITLEDDVEYSAERVPLTSAQIEANVNQLEEENMVTTEKIDVLDGTLEELEQAVNDLEDAYEDSRQNLLSLCIRKRNEYSRKDVQDQFAHGIHILDEETRMEKDADGFDPDQQGRDYQKIARSLPVFCVSSQVYKAKKGLSREKVNTEGFQELDDTEVPQLIAHAKRIAQTNRRKKQLRFLEACLQVFESLQYWLTITTTTAALTQEQSEVEIYHVQDCLERLKKKLEAAAETNVKDCGQIFAQQLFKVFPAAVNKAVQAIEPIVQGWGAETKAGGYYHATYKAVCMRDGVYKKAGRELIDWNEELTTAYKQGIAGAWELVFGSQIPRILESFHVVAQECMEAFHEELLEAAPLAQARRIKMLHPQLMLCVQAIKDGQADFGETIQEWQREASRELTPAIKNYMKAAYDDCKEKRGKGAFSRMKAIIQNQAKNSPRNEFNKISKRIKRNKCKTCENYTAMLTERVDTTIESLRSDYLRCIGQKEITAAPEPVRLAIIELITRLEN